MGLEEPESDFDDDRHSIQPTLMGLISTAGGDYKGRDDTANSKRHQYSGLDMIKSYLPKDWKKRLKRHVATFKKDHD